MPNPLPSAAGAGAGMPGLIDPPPQMMDATPQYKDPALANARFSNWTTPQYYAGMTAAGRSSAIASNLQNQATITPGMSYAYDPTNAAAASFITGHGGALAPPPPRPPQFDPAAMFNQGPGGSMGGLPGLNTGGTNPYLSDPLMANYHGMQNPLYANMGGQQNFYGDPELYGGY